MKQITLVHTCHEARTARYYLWGIEVIFHSIFCSRNFSCSIKIVTVTIEEVTEQQSYDCETVVIYFQILGFTMIQYHILSTRQMRTMNVTHNIEKRGNQYAVGCGTKKQFFCAVEAKLLTQTIAFATGSILSLYISSPHGDSGEEMTDPSEIISFCMYMFSESLTK